MTAHIAQVAALMIASTAMSAIGTGVASPDDADALACTFAEPIAPREMPEYLNPDYYMRDEPYDRFKALGLDDLT